MSNRGEQAAAQRAELERLKEERQEYRREPSALNKARLRIEIAPLLEPSTDMSKTNTDSVRLRALNEVIDFYLKTPERPSMEIIDEALDDLAESIVANEGGKLKAIRDELEVLAEQHGIRDKFEESIEKKTEQWSLKTIQDYETAVREAYGQAEILDDITTQVNRLQQMAQDIPDKKLVEEKIKAFEEYLRDQFKSNEAQWNVLRNELPEKDCQELQSALDTHGVFAFIKKLEELKPVLDAVGIEEVQKAWGMLVINRLQQDFPVIARISANKNEYRRAAIMRIGKLQSDVYNYRNSPQQQKTRLSPDYESQLSAYDKQIEEAKQELELIKSDYQDAQELFSQDREEMHERLNKLLAKYAARSGLSFEQIWTDFIDDIQQIEDEIVVEALEKFEKHSVNRNNKYYRMRKIEDALDWDRTLSMKWVKDRGLKLNETMEK